MIHQTRRTLRRAASRGMTLLEIMIVIAILGMLASVIVVGVMNQFERAKINTTRLKVGSVESAIQQYNVSYGEFPSQGEGLRALLTPPDGGKPFLNEKSVPKDAWNNELMYFSPARKGGKPFEVVSKGPDGQEGSEDDIRAGN
ncbi:type II secretion system major pseudopilin GspG [Myxococcota bacterium]|nr:type II secretion system major pseudopilin GspG [Myxococcota bacterium]MBU1897477.1 type II secretion system major pseudopilin GspG [Myxococcota bacterium]